ncbi:PREDICTED: diphthine methyltransferase-like isoform X1 [Acropora digitifera]|uniref:diphthine methyltransferase-like isoform X1 n=1 Tax=Acropora digitifera TaxID=70779 RepID=UPI00077A39AE|nr:PREDICTED: diphthine methyltransferase-like isoform X1 [Acropora digitifera]
MSTDRSRTICSIDTGYCADTVEWCPCQDFESYLVCGTYQLIEKNGQENDDTASSCASDESIASGSMRVGNIQLYYLDETLGRLERIQTLNTGGILDTKWLPTFLAGCPVLGCVTSNGEVKIFLLKEKKLNETMSLFVSADNLCLSLDWSPEHEKSQVAVSDSAGQISLCQLGEGSSNLQQISQWRAHQYEAWITAFDAWNSAVVYSGGDDCLFRGWDIRTNCQKPTFTSKRHDMGVSSIQCNVKHEYIMATGSYDENIHVWDNRLMKQPLCSVHPGGGVWRIKWHPVHGNSMLTACMYEGFHLLNFTNGNGDQCLKTSVSYTEHGSLAYGADWCLTSLRLEEYNDFKDVQSNNCYTDLVATCSFYDHSLNLWHVQV